MGNSLHPGTNGAESPGYHPVLLKLEGTLKHIGGTDREKYPTALQIAIWLNLLNPILLNLQDSIKIKQLATLLESMTGDTVGLHGDAVRVIIASLYDISDELRAKEKLGDSQRSHPSGNVNIDIEALLTRVYPSGFKNEYLPS